MKNVALDERIEHYIISKEDFNIYFQNRKVISAYEFIEYLNKEQVQQGFKDSKIKLDII